MRAEDTIGRKFYEWTAGKGLREVIVAIFNRIRDIPYAVLPELNSPRDYIHILDLKMGSCTPKHFLLSKMYQRLGLDVLYVVYPYRWAEFKELYPPGLWNLAEQMPIAHHLACRVEINGRYVLVDATIDPPLGRIGLPVNDSWDGISDTCLPVLPIGGEEIYHPSEAEFISPPDLNENTLAFYRGLNDYFDRVRNGKV